MDWYSYVDLFLHSWDKYYLLMCIMFLYASDSECWYVVEKLFLYIHKGYWILLLCCGVFIWPCYQRNAGLIKWVRKSSLLLCLGKVWEISELILLKCLIVFLVFSLSLFLSSLEDIFFPLIFRERVREREKHQ